MFSFISIYDQFKDIATKHKQINSFGFGNLWEIATSGNITYPMLFVMPDGATAKKGEIGNKFQVFIMDKVTAFPEESVPVITTEMVLYPAR